MAQSRTLFLGMEVHKDALAVTSGAQDHGAEVTSLGALGTCQGDLDQRVRQRPSKGPTSDLRLRSRSLWRLALPLSDAQRRRLLGSGPLVEPPKPDDRVNTDRRDARPLARLARVGELPVVSGPQGEDEAIRDLSRAREDAIRDLKDAKFRLKAFLLRISVTWAGQIGARPTSGGSRQ